MASLGGSLMGRLVERLRLKCEFCKSLALPNSIRGYYADGKLAVIHECPMCGYIRHHNKIGFVELNARKFNKSRRKNPMGVGRLSEKLRAAEKGLRL